VSRGEQHDEAQSRSIISPGSRKPAHRPGPCFPLCAVVIKFFERVSPNIFFFRHRPPSMR
ncbi:MAG: hypothetical protein ACREF1_02225, partial [Acetobacteraceae bacterium]